MIEAQGDFNRPWLVGSFGAEYLPSIPDLHERLSKSGAKVADVACGVGWAAISLAKAYPNIIVDGFDLDEPSIELAKANAAEFGVSDRVTFMAGDAADVAFEETYDLATMVESIHDMSQPVAVLRSIRRMLKPGGTLLVADERTEDAFTAPASETERMFHVYSVLCCASRRRWTIHLGRHGHRHATIDVRGVCEGDEVRQGGGPADRARLPALLPPRSLSGTDHSPVPRSDRLPSMSVRTAVGSNCISS